MDVSLPQTIAKVTVALAPAFACGFAVQQALQIIDPLVSKPQMIGKKLYFSELYVHSFKNLAGVNPKAGEFANKIMNLVPTKLGVPFEVAAFGFWPTQATPHTVLGPFRFERKLQTLPTENKYYSTGPLHTDDHLKLLEEFEAIFMA